MEQYIVIARQLKDCQCFIVTIKWSSTWSLSTGLPARHTSQQRTSPSTSGLQMTRGSITCCRSRSASIWESHPSRGSTLVRLKLKYMYYWFAEHIHLEIRLASVLVRALLTHWWQWHYFYSCSDQMKTEAVPPSDVIYLSLCRYGEKRLVSQREALPAWTECHYWNTVHSG